MNVTVSHIRSALQECYPPREAANLSRIVCCEMLGQSHIDYYLGKDMILSPKDEKELDKINQMISGVHPDLLIACFGCPKQEKWIYENISKYDAKVSVCAGATVDFLSGNVNRAPRWMSEHGLEWFYRFLQEPKRMFKRYFVDDVKIVGLIKKYR